MFGDDPATDRPNYDAGDRAMLRERAPRAAEFARQILETVRPFLRQPIEKARVLDIGAGYGHAAIELARTCKHVTGIEPSGPLYDFAVSLKCRECVSNVEFIREGIYEHQASAQYDLVVLDNVLEHLPDHPAAIQKVAEFLKPGGAAYVVVPNKLWPLEVHYRLPFLSYLPLRFANLYLRVTRRGHDYSDASYAPTFWGLSRLLKASPTLSYQFVLPADLSWTTYGSKWHYRIGAAAIRRFGFLWAVSKMLLVIVVKKS